MVVFSYPFIYAVHSNRNICRWERLIRTYRTPIIAAALVIVALLNGCSTVLYRTDPKLIGYSEQGIASFYSMKFMFRKTSSGERLNQLALTAAHKTLPFGTKVRVTNIKNQQSVIVRINDRGPFIKGRIIDLTRHAFSRIASTSTGIIKVKIEVIQ